MSALFCLCDSTFFTHASPASRCVRVAPLLCSLKGNVKNVPFQSGQFLHSSCYGGFEDVCWYHLEDYDMSASCSTTSGTCFYPGLTLIIGAKKASAQTHRAIQHVPARSCRAEHSDHHSLCSAAISTQDHAVLLLLSKSPSM